MHTPIISALSNHRQESTHTTRVSTQKTHTKGTWSVDTSAGQFLATHPTSAFSVLNSGDTQEHAVP